MNATSPAPLVWLIGSRTGGPLIPLLALKDELAAERPELRFMILGVRGGFEEEAARSEQLPLAYLPEVKGPSGGGLGRLVSMNAAAVGLVLSTLKVLIYVRRYRPTLVLSMSNFLSVPVIWGCAVVNRWRRVASAARRLFGYGPLPLIRTSLHQLDIENLTSRLAGGLVDSYSAGLAEICRNNPRVTFFPNPVRRARLDALSRQSARELLAEAKLYSRSNRKPLLLIFGGGSGSEFINHWVEQNLPDLTHSFYVLHLTGFLQTKKLRAQEGRGYRRATGLTDLMPAALTAADVVICRAGMSTISELLYLQKNAYIVPIPASHQVVNARAVSRYFRILEQPQSADWITLLISQKREGFPQFKRVHWDYYAPERHHMFRDRLLAMLSPA